MTTPALTEDRMREAVEAVAKHGDISAAATALGVPRSTLDSRYRRAKAYFTQKVVRAQTPPITPVAPEGFEIRSIASGVDAEGNVQKQWIGARLEGSRDTETVPAGHMVKGLSTLVDETGAVRAQWIKTRVEDDKYEMALNAAREQMCAELPAFTEVQPRETHIEDLLYLLTMTDCHVGMLAWGKETHAAPWDLEIAERVLTETFIRMLDAAPQAGTCVINQLGDFVHFDSLLPATPSSGHILDADSRYQKVVQAVVRILERIILHALSRFARVHVYMHEGNHDMAGSVWLRVIFSRLFRDNPRCTVELNPNPYQCFQHGKTMLGFHHGHLAKKEKLPQIFAAQYAQMWGLTQHRYVHTGHYHEVHEKENPGITVMQHPTIASPDAYAARNGYMSKRQAIGITYSSKLGEIARATYLPTEY
jgi:hypothetical protein